MITEIEKEELYDEFKRRLNEEKRNKKSYNCLKRARDYYNENCVGLNATGGWEQISALTCKAFRVRYLRYIPDSMIDQANDFAISLVKVYFDQLKQKKL